jgi:hypothetical protein
VPSGCSELLQTTTEPGDAGAWQPPDVFPRTRLSVGVPHDLSIEMLPSSEGHVLTTRMMPVPGRHAQEGTLIELRLPPVLAQEQMHLGEWVLHGRVADALFVHHILAKSTKLSCRSTKSWISQSLPVTFAKQPT